MALADLIASISQLISSFLWICSQPVYWIHGIYETNYEAVSAVFSAVYYSMFYAAKAVQLLGFGTLSMVQMILDFLGSLKYVIRFIESAVFALVKAGIQLSHVAVSLCRLMLFYGPWLVGKVWYGMTWCYTAIGYGIKLAFDAAGRVPSPSVLFEPLKGIISLLHVAVMSFGAWMISAFQAVSNVFCQVTTLVSGLVTGALTAVLDAFLRCLGDLWQMRTILEDSFATAKAYSGQKAAEMYTEILEAGSNAIGSLMDLAVAFLSTISYVGIFAVVCLLVVLIPWKLYGLFVKALSSANTMVSHFLHLLSRRQRHLRNHRWQARHQQNMEQRLPRERDADYGSLLQPRRRAPGVPQSRVQSTPQPELQVPARPPPADGPGPSGEHYQRGTNPQRSSPSAQTSNPPFQESTTSPAANNLTRQLEEERDRQLCVVCQDNAKNILIMPCKHLCVCLECVEEITSQPRRDLRKCPLCRQAIRSYLEVYA